MNNEQEKRTDITLSVGADNSQTLANQSTYIIDESLDIGNIDSMETFLPEYIKTVSLSELYDTAYRPRMQLIDGMLGAGTYLFVGAPKVGKSFFMAQLAYHVSNGHKLWEYETHQGTVLYLALEDDYSRLQQRLSRMFGTDNCDHLFFATDAKHLGDGLDEQMRFFMKKHPQTKLIIIDTLQKIREVGGEQYSYSSDYEIVTKLKTFSDSYNICILLVHHTRKQGADDRFDTISGTNGLLGAADGAFVMQKENRTDNEATLDIVGRDQQDQRLHIFFEREQCIWKLTSIDTELWIERLDPVIERVTYIVSDEFPHWEGTASSLIEQLALDVQPNVLTRKLNINVARLWNEHRIRYENKRTHHGRMIRLIKEKEEA